MVGTFTAGAGKVGGGGDGLAGVGEAWGYGDHVGIEGANDSDEGCHCSLSVDEVGFVIQGIVVVWEGARLERWVVGNKVWTLNWRVEAVNGFPR